VFAQHQQGYSVIKQAIINGAVFDGNMLLRDHAVILADGRITSIEPQDQLPPDLTDVYDLLGGTLIPGFIDLQVNGGGGVLFNTAPSVDSLRMIGAAHRRFGTTGFMPTLITDSFAAMREAVTAVREAISERVPGVLGLHLEGPFLNAQRKGVHDANKFCELNEEGFSIVTSLGVGKTIVTLAPEITSPAMIRRLHESGIIVCAGHSAATYEQTREAFAMGVTGVTHLFNAMTGLQSREPGMVGAAIADEDSWFGIIADGHHSHPGAFRIAVNAKKRGGAVLVTDAMSTVGSVADSFVLDGETIYVRQDRIINAAGTLAGSCLDMLTAVNNATHFAGLDWFEAVRMATVYPATALGLQGELGLIKPGYRANLVALDTQRRIRSSWIDGVRV
jgi:N-acetylglucosamine-6-phosphate deacetylase